MKKVLVTGVNGFIGRSIVDVLNENYFVIGTGRQDISLSRCREYIKWDIGHEVPPKILTSMNIDCIVHAAACIEKNDLSEELVYTNCVGTFNVVRATETCGVKNFIYISSLPIIGNIHSVPIDEKAILLPDTMYHATKAAGELISLQARNSGIKVTSLRVPSPIGPGMPINTIVPIFIRRIKNGEDIILHGKGTRKQNYIDVRDIGEAIKRIIAQNGINGVFNIGSKNIFSNKELAKICINTLNSTSKLVFSGQEDTLDEIDWTTDDSKLRLSIGDYQSYSMVESIFDIARKME